MTQESTIPDKCDVLIVGAGPAGASAAYLLARQGLDVVCCEARGIPRDKPCGDGIGPRSVLALRELGLTEWLESGSFYKTENLRIVSYSGRSIVSNPRNQFEILHGYVVPRQYFDARLVEHARSAGARFYAGARVTPIADSFHQTGRARVKHEGHEQSISAPLLVAADGSAGGFSRTLLGETAAPQAVAFRGYLSALSDLEHTATIMFSDRMPKGYGWIFPLSANEANVGVGSLGMRGGGRVLRSEYQRFLGETRAPVDITRGVEGATKGGAVMRMNFGRAPLTSGRVAFLGDAAGLVSPINGEGISHAIESSLLLAECLEGRFTDTSGVDRALSVYGKRMRRKYLSYFRWGNFLGQALGDKDRMDRLIAMAGRDEYLADLVIGVLANTYHPKMLLRPKSWSLRRLLTFLGPSPE